MPTLWTQPSPESSELVDAMPAMVEEAGAGLSPELEFLKLFGSCSFQIGLRSFVDIRCTQRDDGFIYS